MPSLCLQDDGRRKNVQTKAKGTHTGGTGRNPYKGFFRHDLPGTIKFLSDHYIVGDSYRCVWAIREYPPSTEEQAILSQLADRSGVTLRIYHRLVESMEGQHGGVHR